MNKNDMIGSAAKQTERMTRSSTIVLLLISLIGGFVLWVYAIGYDSTLFERTFDGVAVEIEGESRLVAEKGFTLAEGQTFSSVTIVAKGKRSELNELDASDFRAVIDVSQATGAGNQHLNIVVYSPNGIEVISQSSTTATVFVDKFTQRNELISVSVDTGSNYVMSEGVTFVNAIANPLTVLVSGPESVLDSIDKANVKFNLDGQSINDNIYGYGAIELLDKNGKVIENPYITVSETTAYVSITVTKQKTVPVKVAFTGGIFDPSEVDIQLSAASVTVSGSPEALKGIDELVLNIDETTINGEGTFEFPVSAMLPDGVKNDSGVSKISAKIVLPKLAVREYHIKEKNITVINLPEGSEFTINNGLDITLIGPRDAFDDIDRGAITATVDFYNVTVEADGSYTADATISLGGEYPLIYLQNVSYKVNFTVE